MCLADNNWLYAYISEVNIAHILTPLHLSDCSGYCANEDFTHKTHEQIGCKVTD